MQKKKSKLQLLEELSRKKRPIKPKDENIRAENEDDDGYDPYSDRAPEKEDLFSSNPWN